MVFVHQSTVKTTAIPIFCSALLLIIFQLFGLVVFHTFAELFTVIVGFVIFIVALTTFQLNQNSLFVLLGITYGNVALLDLFHLLTIPSMPLAIANNPQITLHLWVYARVIEAIALVIVPSFMGRTITLKPYLLGITTASILLLFLAFSSPMPIFINHNGLTMTKVFAEYAIIALLIVAFWRFYRIRQSIETSTNTAILISIIFTVFAEFLFTLYRDFHHIPFVFGHVAKFISFWFIYQGLIAHNLVKPFALFLKQASTYDAIPHITLVVDDNGFIHQLNQAAKNYLNQPASSQTHQHHLLHDPNIAINDCPICQAIGQHLPLKNVLILHNQKWFMVSTAPIMLEQHISTTVCTYTDVTETINTKTALAQQEQLLSQLLDNTETVSILGFNQDRQLFYINQAAERLFDLDRTKVINQYYEQLFPLENPIQLKQQFEQWLTASSTIPSFKRNLHLSHTTTRYLYTNVVVIRSPKQQTLMYLFDIDISAMRLAEQQLLEKQAIVQAVFEAIPDIFFLMDNQGVILQYHSNQQADLYVDPAKFIHKKMYDVLPYPLNEQFKQQVLKALASHNLEYFDYPLTVNGVKKYFEARVKSLPNQQVIAMIKDVTSQKNNELALHEKEQLYRQMFEHNSAIKLIIDPNTGNIIEANRAAKEFYGYGDQLLQMTIMDLRVDAIDTVREDINSTIKQQKTFFQTQHRLASGETRTIEVHSGPIQLGNKTVLFSIIQDISEQQKAITELIETEKRLQDLFNNTSSIIYIKDKEGHYIGVNKSFEALFNITEPEIRGKTDFDLFEPEIAQQFRHNDQLAINSQTPIEKEEKVYINGEYRYYISIKFPMRNSHNEVSGICAISTDITERKQAEQQILHQAHYDSLTELPNRFLSLDRLKHLVVEAKRNESLVAVLFLDLDDFKKINDSLGHAIGDQLLIQAAERLTAIVRQEDTVGRLGGDEFIVLLKDLKQTADAESVIKQLLKTFRHPFVINERELMITLSIGVAIYPDNGSTPDELLRNADAAMYNAKQQGRNTCAYFNDEMNAILARRLAVEEQLQGALQRDELTVYFQPQIQLQSNTIIGAEALIRWQNSTLGTISPVEFIPIAEQSGLIISIGQYVIKQSLALIQQWQQAHQQPLRIAVNLSPRQFRDPNLVRFIATALSDSGVQPSQLELEITEGVLLSGHRYIDNALNELADMGITLSMDDFGTGYSSLSYLRKYPFHVLKIDRGFVDGILTTKADKELVNASITLAHSLGMKVVAEGVESAEQLTLLSQLNCDFAQGFYIAKPMPAKKLLALSLTFSPPAH
jgi:diguanylate cyclase (GGDEF)-like protein/PAS domain S-box-containing protein